MRPASRIYDDFHYPLEEPKEMASVTAPTQIPFCG